tara:strand:+ start:1563 stop:2516 length:954 start_codon:yes stop_codon:yes gene_type:complete
MSTLPSQATVKNSWKSEEVKVTCLVVCYNHQDYIFDCLKGIVSQKTDFAFKVVVYDDFSTDETRKVLRDFEELYPDIFDIYYADFNHYGVAAQDEHLGKLEGDYVAMCEGDDYWIDNLKLKKQYAEICKRGGFLCVHPAVIFFQGSSSEDLFCYYGNQVKILPQKLIMGLKNQFAPTASYLISIDKYLEYTRYRSNIKGLPGDFFLEILASDKGVIYLPDIMSAYRRGSENSHSVRQTQVTVDDVNGDLTSWVRGLDVLKEYRPHLGRYIEEKKTLVEVDCLLRMHQLESNASDKEVSKRYMVKATQLLRDLGPLEC